MLRLHLKLHLLPLPTWYFIYQLYQAFMASLHNASQNYTSPKLSSTTMLMSDYPSALSFVTISSRELSLIQLEPRAIPQEVTISNPNIQHIIGAQQIG